MQSHSGIVFDIKRFAVHDGPGIRQTVFLKGCPLGCWWCHNPESQRLGIEYYDKIQRLDDLEVTIKQAIGERMSVAEVMQSVEKDTIFFDESGGGVTFSGGEPFVQHQFLESLLKACKQQGIHTTVDTTGHVAADIFQKLSPLIDLYLFDVKHLDADIHNENTGVSLKLISENLEYLFNNQKNVILRYPIIPDINADDDYLNQFIQKFVTYQQQIIAIDLLPFHKIGAHKYQRVGRTERMRSHRDIAQDEIEHIQKRLTEAGFNVNV